MASTDAGAATDLDGASASTEDAASNDVRAMEIDGPCGAIPASVPTETFVATAVDAICCAAAKCCAGASFSFDRDACVRSWTREQEHLLRVTSPSQVYDGAGAARCIEKLREISSRCVYSTLDELKAACPDVYTGTVPVGGPCQSNNDCREAVEGPVRCAVSLPGALPLAPICIVDPPGLEGEACLGPGPDDPSGPSFPHAICAEGLYCDLTSHCHPRLAAGAACYDYGQCEAALHCEPSSSACVPNRPEGAACSLDEQCAPGTCYQSACAPGIPISAMGCSP
jgi:hypothetical protein